MKTALAEHVEDDPLYKCKYYDKNNSFNHCIDKELEVGKQFMYLLSSQAKFLRLLDCVPLWFAADALKMCNTSLDLTQNSSVSFAPYLCKHLLA